MIVSEYLLKILTMAEGSRIWAISLLTMMLVFPLLSAAPLNIAGDIKDDNDGMHSHDENVTRGGKFFGHSQVDIGKINIYGGVEGDVKIDVNIDVHGHAQDHNQHEDDTECEEGLSVLFKSIDSNKNGIVDAKELLMVCHQNNIQITESLAVRMLTQPDKTVEFNMAKFCELLKNCPSTKSADIIYFLLQLYDEGISTATIPTTTSTTTSPGAWRQKNEADCWYKCGSKDGSCPTFCGVGGFCCRKGYSGCPAGAPEASPKYHTCVIQIGTTTTTVAATTAATSSTTTTTITTPTKTGDGVNNCFSAEGCPLIQNNLITTLELKKEFQISFEFQPVQYIAGWQNVLHMTTGKNTDRKVALWVKNDGQLHLWFTAKSILTEQYATGQWHSVEFSQRLEGTQYIYRVKINGVKVVEVVNSEPNIFSNVKVYVSDPWHNALKGTLRNLVINMEKTKGPGCTCPLVWLPVCGADGNTYSNTCAACGVDVECEGECPCSGGQGDFCGDEKCNLKCGAGEKCVEDEEVQCVQAPCCHRWTCTVAGCSRDEIEKLCWCPQDYSPVCAGGRLYNNLCLHECAKKAAQCALHECAKKEAKCADLQPIPAVGDIAECVDPSTKGIVNREAIKEFKMTLLDIENELANLVNSRRKRDGLAFTEEQLLLLNSIVKGSVYLYIECSSDNGQCHVEKIKGFIEESKSSFTAVKEAGRVSSGFLEDFILERGKFDKIADVAGKVQEKTAVKRPPQEIVVDGGWSAWSSWSDCTGTCGEETRTRTRACSIPAGGKSCPGAATEAESCGLNSCEGIIVDGGWSAWSSWSDCTGTCGEKTRTRTRACSSPAEGKSCPGAATEAESCGLPSCEGIIVDGGWSAWSSWSDCTGTCGEETRMRTRACSSPAGGKSCPGAATEAESCGLNSCEEKLWRDDGRCGESYPLRNGHPGQCDPNGVHPCCSNKGWCGKTDAHCKCSSCINYADICQNGNGEDYNGIVRKTTSGLYCQKWTSQSPHSHDWESLGNHNYCRNPDGEPGVWCYTTNHDKRWELCDVQVCNEGEGEAGGPTFLIVAGDHVLAESFDDIEKAKAKLMEVTTRSRLIAEVDSSGNLKRDPHEVGGQNQGGDSAAGFNKYWDDWHDINRMMDVAQRFLDGNTGGEVLELNAQNFDGVVSSYSYILVLFYSPWCGYCKQLFPEYDAAAKILAEKPIGSYTKMAKIDNTVHKALGSKYKISAYPTLKLFYNGQESAEYSGARNANAIVDWLTGKSTISSPQEGRCDPCRYGRCDMWVDGRCHKYGGGQAGFHCVLPDSKCPFSCPLVGSCWKWGNTLLYTEKKDKCANANANQGKPNGCFVKGECNNKKQDWSVERSDTWGCENLNSCTDKDACQGRPKTLFEFCENNEDQPFISRFIKDEVEIMFIYPEEYLPKNGNWNLLFRQTINGKDELFKKNEWTRNKENVDAPNYSILGDFEKFRKPDGSFHLFLWYPELGTGNEWVQTSNPVTKTSGGVDNYKGILTPYTGYAWGGLEHNNGAALLDGSLDSGLWWYAIGSTTDYSGGIPGPKDDKAHHVVKKVELYIDYQGATMFDYCSISTDHTMCKYSGPSTTCKANTIKRDLSDADKQAIVKKHNELRGKVANGLEKRGQPGPQPAASDMLLMVWDDELATIAQRWADQCTYEHDTKRNMKGDTNGHVGQNVYIRYSTAEMTDADLFDSCVLATTKWYEEVKDFDKDNVNSFKPSSSDSVTGHYTQVVWGSSRAVGCGSVYYKASPPDYPYHHLVICNYFKGGNIIDGAMYSPGTACSACPSGYPTCSDGLCN